MCAASAALEFLRNAGEVEGKYLQDIGLLGGETQRGQQHANKSGDEWKVCTFTLCKSCVHGE
jgi:hypothetical protein